jgi:hypothetical protein
MPLTMYTRKGYELKLGKPIYSFTLYQKIKRATITLENVEYPILMASFDLEADHENIIVNKVLPMVNEEELWISSSRTATTKQKQIGKSNALES